MEIETAPSSDTSPRGRLTPLMTQYWDIKAVHHDKIVLFRMGDFFEMFHRDAEIAAPVLGIALTSRNKKSQDETPMCGVPHHSVANTINKLLASGFKIAICDQIEDPKFAKGLVKRAVTRILSPGMVYDPDTVDAQVPHYLASWDEESISFLDATSGEGFYFLVDEPARRERLLRNLRPVEIVISSIQAQYCTPLATLSVHDSLGDQAVQDVTGPAPESARRLVSYAVAMQGDKILATLLPFAKRTLHDCMALPASTIEHLELFFTYRGEKKGSLFQAINRCKTSAGARLLRERLQFPLTQVSAIEQRLELVEMWRQDQLRLEQIRKTLGGLGDVQRRLGKLASPSVHPRDLLALAESLRVGLEVIDLSVNLKWDELAKAAAIRVAGEIERELEPEPPAQIKNGGFIRRGVSAELDELINLSTHSGELLLRMEAEERDATGIPSLKIRFNNVFGYYIEITHTHKDKVPKNRYERKQTLANAERFITPELAELERKVLLAQTRRVELENEIFLGLVKKSLKESRLLLRLAQAWAELDVDSALAWLSIEQNYARPQFSQEGRLHLKAARHPVIEQTIQQPFTANDCGLESGQVLLLTGPNMAGKSTLMRTVALAAIMAQAGSHVPASEALLPIFDRVSTRIGASDSLSEGLSTFMVEMKETAEILNQSTKKSLIILDEIGRGTSTYDGMSLAQAILENLLEHPRGLVLFATHYHELTRLDQQYAPLVCGHMRIHEKNGVVTFLHQLSQGPANKSYGIHVAKLAGLPAAVTTRAAVILRKLEAGGQEASPQMTLLDSVIDGQAAPQAVSPETQTALEIAAQIQQLDLNALSPLGALNQIAQWRQELS